MQSCIWGRLSRFSTSSVPYRNVSKTFLNFKISWILIAWLVYFRSTPKSWLATTNFSFWYANTTWSTWIYKPLFDLRTLTSTFRYDTIRAKWKTGFISPRTIPSTTLDFLPTKHDQNSRWVYNYCPSGLFAIVKLRQKWRDSDRFISWSVNKC